MTKECHRCGTCKPVGEFGPFKAAPDGLNYWCRPCYNEYFRDRRRRLGLVKPQLAKVCAECDQNFTTARQDQRFCDDDCSRKYHRRKSQQPWNDRRRANHHKRRALKKSATIGDLVSLDEIRRRDGNRCGICSGEVNGAVWPDPLSASLDHIIPLSRGGSHDPTNIQLAHLGCNVKKGAN